jgi:SAM-dependent methyltransferase
MAGMNPAEFANIAQAEAELWWYRGQREILNGILDPFVRARPGIREVLEGGCGTGYNSRYLADRYHWTMTPLDLGWDGLRYAQGYGLTRRIQANIAALPFTDASFDAVASLDVVVHFPRGEEAVPLREFARVLKPGGLFVTRMSALDLLRSRHSLFVDERQRFTAGRLRRALEQAGFRVLRITYANSLLLPVALFKFRVWEPLTNAAPASGVAMPGALMNELLYQPLRIESWLTKTGFNLPVGQSLLVIAERA